MPNIFQDIADIFNPNGPADRRKIQRIVKRPIREALQDDWRNVQKDFENVLRDRKFKPRQR